jgi:hypothetical protein
MLLLRCWTRVPPAQALPDYGFGALGFGDSLDLIDVSDSLSPEGRSAGPLEGLPDPVSREPFFPRSACGSSSASAPGLSVIGPTPQLPGASTTPPWADSSHRYERRVLSLALFPPARTLTEQEGNTPLYLLRGRTGCGRGARVRQRIGLPPVTATRAPEM